MVVDDDPIFRMLVRRVAEQLGKLPGLILCANLRETVEPAERADFWVVDVHLPDGFGPEWVEQQRAAGYRQPALLLSHSSWEGNPAGLGSCAFALKPVRLDRLKELMQGWWSQ
ncbi:response regulator [bacterium]|nr:response regulator [bacterium]